MNILMNSVAIYQSILSARLQSIVCTDWSICDQPHFHQRGQWMSLKKKNPVQFLASFNHIPGSSVFMGMWPVNASDPKIGT